MHNKQRISYLLASIFLGGTLAFMGCASQQASLQEDHLFGDHAVHQAIQTPPPLQSHQKTRRPKPLHLPNQPLPVPGVVSPLPPTRSAPLSKVWPAPMRFPIWQLAPQPHLALLRRQVLRIAQSRTGKKRPLRYRGQYFRFDCSGYISFAYAHLGFQLLSPTSDPLGGFDPANGVKRIYRYSRHIGAFHDRKIPEVGDLIFWHGTYDVNRDGRLNDPWTHIAIVESVDRHGTITFLHAEKTRVRRGRMNLLLPHHQRDTNYNTLLRRCRQPGDRCHTSELWAGFATLLKTPLPPHLDGSLTAPRLSFHAPQPKAPTKPRQSPLSTKQRRWVATTSLSSKPSTQKQP
ncbi:MAG: CHAP domain-containing protein [Myxococcales bacterium]|nr:CHAP domain-containing protein [Myxococcales bacterium]